MDEDQILSNLKIAEKLQNENNGQFLTLVRMHLSFEIDLELENSDPGTEKLKSKFWNKLQWRTGKYAFPSTTDTTPILSQSIINQIKKLVKFLEKEESKKNISIACRLFLLLNRSFLILDITQEGIFRKTGSLARQQVLFKKLMEDIALIPQEDIDLSLEFTAHDCASVLKNVLAEFDEPVISLNYFFAFQQVAGKIFHYIRKF